MLSSSNVFIQFDFSLSYTSIHKAGIFVAFSSPSRGGAQHNGTIVHSANCIVSESATDSRLLNHVLLTRFRQVGKMVEIDVIVNVILYA